jgi:hypothetical protein
MMFFEVERFMIYVSWNVYLLILKKNDVIFFIKKKIDF